MKIRFARDGEALVVAEIGNNHEGDFESAKILVSEAARAGADAVKFQTFIPELFMSRSDEARFRRLESFRLSFDQFEHLAGLAHDLGLFFISTPLDMESAAFLDRIVDAFKIASGDNDFYPLIEKTAATGKPLIVSTGASDLERVSHTVAFIEAEWARRGIEGELAVLHCVSSYPVPFEQVNLRAIEVLLEQLSCAVGYSDHTVGIEAPVLAAALGATIIEKHFTLDKNRSDFRDHKLSADPAEMKELVHRVHLAGLMRGKREKVVQRCEEPAAALIRRSIVAAKDLPGGRRLSLADLLWVRPAGGLAPGEEKTLIGKILKRGVSFGERLLRSDVE